MHVACTGGALIDVLVHPLNQLPLPGKSALAEDIQIFPGGCGINTAILLARLGIHTHFLGRIGNDRLGRFLLNQLDQEGIDVENLILDDTLQTKASLLTVRTGGEHSLIRTSAVGNALNKDDLSLFDLKNIQMMHFGGIYSLKNLLGEDLKQYCMELKNQEIVITMDTVWTHDQNWEAIIAALPYVDFFLPSLDEAQALTGKSTPQAIARSLRKIGVPIVVVKLGREGAYLSYGTQEGLIPACLIPANKVVDTTGAGDAFCAGFIAALVADKTIPEAVTWGHGAGALAVQALGATTGIRNRKQLMMQIQTS
jgi:sugar/nucleoside kinase (ribokinase family)